MEKFVRMGIGRHLQFPFIETRGCPSSVIERLTGIVDVGAIEKFDFTRVNQSIGS